jgi:broad specificity phosphatase PhoE
MTKRIYFIRHAEAGHNVAYNLYGEFAYESPSFRDADITLNGISQAEKLAISMDFIPFEVVFTSPLVITLHTSSILFKQHCIPIIASEDIRERYDRHPVNNRQDITQLKELYQSIDFSEIISNEDLLYNTPDDLEERAKSFIKYVLARPEKCMAVVSHETFLREVLSQFRIPDYSLKNCEYKCIEVY